MGVDSQISITICGDGGCGKSSITLRIVRGQWTHEYDPTIEDSYSVTRTVDGTTHNLNITDTAGQEEYRSMWSAANMNSDAFLLVYDITSTSSLQQLNYFRHLIDEECQNRMEANRCWPALMVVGNKCDLQSNRQVSSREGLEWARSRGYGFMETSAREMVNIEETIAAIVKRVVEARRMHKSGMQMPALGNGGTPVTANSPMVDQRSYTTVGEKTGSPFLGQGPEQQRMGMKKKRSIWERMKCW